MKAARKKQSTQASEYVAERPSRFRRVARQVAASAYSSPLAEAGRTIATKYTWSPVRRSSPLPLRRREQPVLHIFQYHRVNNDRDPFLGGLGLDLFRAQMEYLAKNFPIA